MKLIVTIAIISLLIASIALSGIALYQYRANQQNILKTEMAGLSGVVTVSVTDPNGTVVSQKSSDAIVAYSYDYIACLVWGVGCNTAGAGINFLFPTTTITTTATISQYQGYNSYLTGLAISTGTQSSSACTNIQTANGLSPLVSSVTHNQGVNTPIVTLTGSWTYTGTSITLSSVCLVPATSDGYVSALPVAVISPQSTMTAFAYENFSGQTLTSGQSISVAWTFNL